MTWLQRYRYRHFLSNSMWVSSTLGLILALASHRVLYLVGRAMGWNAATEPDAARAVIGALSSSLLTFIVFVSSALLVAVQLASAQLSPRIIALALKEPGIRTCLGIFVFNFTFSLAVLSRIGTQTPLIELQVCIWSSLGSIIVFLYMVDRLARSLRPISILTLIAGKGAEVIKSVYPLMLDEGPRAVSQSLPDPSTALVVEHIGRSSVLLAFDQEGLLTLASQENAIIELMPQVGDFVVHGDGLFRIYGSTRLSPDVLRRCLALGDERTMEQDPAFAFRIIVDVACRALSRAINDPTTGVLALDQVHLLLRLTGLRRLDTGCVSDSQGRLRLVFRTPDWEDFVWLGLAEIRQFGAGNIQIARRMRALLEHLLKVMPPGRQPALREQLELLDRSVARSFPDDEDREQASSKDLQGLGGSAAPALQVEQKTGSAPV
ncbi:MAG: hypothetical protein AMXMBFR33_05850 [Candidatus Xenobia bacterium]